MGENSFSADMGQVQKALAMKQRLLVFHRIVAPYRIDFFNCLSDRFNTRICLYQTNLLNQTFDYSQISKQFTFSPIYLLKRYAFTGNRLKKGIWHEMRDFKPDIILVSECGQDSLLAIIYKLFFNHKCKIISMIDDSYDMVANNRHFSKAHKYAEKLIIPMLDNIVNVEPRVTNFFRHKYNKGIYFPIIQDDERRCKAYEESLHICPLLKQQYALIGKKVILFVGRLVELKNLQRLIPIFTSINNPDWVLILIGDGDYKFELQKISSNAENIIFVGRQEGKELNAWYNISDILVLPSTQEAFGAVTNEALLAGSKVLISKLAGSQCLVEEGRNGYTIDPYDTEDIKAKMILLMNSVKSKEDDTILRPNLMPESFDDCFNRMLTHWNV